MIKSRKLWSRIFLSISVLITVFILFFIIDIINRKQGESSTTKALPKKLKYRTYFGNCPSRVAGNLTIKLVKTFEKNYSLRDVKKQIVKENLSEKHFLSSYRINYDPLGKFLKFNFNCPLPLMKVQVYKGDGMESYEAVLVEGGKLLDPTYEVLLKNEHKLNHDLPFLALPVKNMDSKVQHFVAKLVKEMDIKFRRKLSEIILNDKGALTVILSINGGPSSVFIGKDLWEEKMAKLQRIIKYMESISKIPSIINLTNIKKVVVKFSDNS